MNVHGINGWLDYHTINIKIWLPYNDKKKVIDFSQKKKEKSDKQCTELWQSLIRIVQRYWSPQLSQQILANSQFIMLIIVIFMP